MLSHLNSHSSQMKTYQEGQLEFYQEVSDEWCSVHRNMTVSNPYLVCVHCVQLIASNQELIQDRSYNEDHRITLETNILTWNYSINEHKRIIHGIETELEAIAAAAAKKELEAVAAAAEKEGK